MYKYFIVLLIGLPSCLLQSDKPIDLDDFEFKTTDSSELFFKNVRQSYYELEERKEAKMNVFRWRENKQTETKIQPIIIHNWLRDEAYLWLEVDDTLIAEAPVFILAGDTETIEHSFSNNSKEDNFKMANLIFNAILDNADISLSGIQILEKESQERSDFMLVMNDYYRLVSLK